MTIRPGGFGFWIGHWHIKVRFEFDPAGLRVGATIAMLYGALTGVAGYLLTASLARGAATGAIVAAVGCLMVWTL